MITAEHVYQELLDMPVQEREKLFAVVARRGFEKAIYRHDEVFDDIRQTPFTLQEAAAYLEVTEIAVRRWIQSGTLTARKVGRRFGLDPDLLKQFKRALTTSKNALECDIDEILRQIPARQPLPGDELPVETERATIENA